MEGSYANTPSVGADYNILNILTKAERVARGPRKGRDCGYGAESQQRKSYPILSNLLFPSPLYPCSHTESLGLPC